LLQISTISSGLRYADAMRLLSSLEDASRGSGLNIMIYAMSYL